MFFTSELEGLEVFGDSLPVAVPDICQEQHVDLLFLIFGVQRGTAVLLAAVGRSTSVLLLAIVLVFLLVFTPTA